MLVLKRNAKRWRTVFLSSIAATVALFALTAALDNSTKSQATTHSATAKTTGKTRLFTVKITQNVTTSNNDWKIKGTTDAPDGAKVVAFNTDSDLPIMTVAQSEDVTYPKVHSGKFEAVIDPINAISANTYRANQSVKLHVVALTNYHKDLTDVVSSKFATEIAADSPTTKFTLTAGQARYFNSLDDDSDSSSSSKASSKKKTPSSTGGYSASEGEHNAQTYSYGNFIKSDDWVGKSYHISKAEVLQADESDGQTTLLVYTDDDPDHLFMVVYDGKTAAVEDDYVDIQGVFSKRQTYDTKIGGSNTVPALVAKKVTVTGHDSE